MSINKVLQLAPQAEQPEVHAELNAALEATAVELREESKRPEYGATELPRTALELADKPEVSTQAIRVLVNLSSANQENSVRIVDGGGVDIACRATRNAIATRDANKARNTMALITNLVNMVEDRDELESPELLDLLFYIVGSKEVQDLWPLETDDVKWSEVVLWAGIVLELCYAHPEKYQVVRSVDILDKFKWINELCRTKTEGDINHELVNAASVSSLILATVTEYSEFARELFNHGAIDVIADLSFVAPQYLYDVLWRIVMTVSSDTEECFDIQDGRLVESTTIKKLRECLKNGKGEVAVAVYGNIAVTDELATAVAHEPGLLDFAISGLDKDDHVKYMVLLLLHNLSICDEPRHMVAQRPIFRRLISLADYGNTQQAVHRSAMHELALLAQEKDVCNMLYDSFPTLCKAYFAKPQMSGVPMVLATVVGILRKDVDEDVMRVFTDYLSSSFVDADDVGKIIVALTFIHSHSPAMVMDAIRDISDEFFKLLENMPLPIKHNMAVLSLLLSNSGAPLSAEEEMERLVDLAITE